jgi:hypothetical protein
MRVEIEASNCDRSLNAQDRELTEKLQEDLRTVLQELKNFSQIQESLNRLEIKLDLDKLPFAKGARGYFVHACSRHALALLHPRDVSYGS